MRLFGMNIKTNSQQPLHAHVHANKTKKQPVYRSLAEGRDTICFISSFMITFDVSNVVILLFVVVVDGWYE